MPEPHLTPYATGTYLGSKTVFNLEAGLISQAKATWRPSQGPIVYDAPTVTTVDDQVTARLRGAHRLSPEGVWLDGTVSSTVTLPLTLVQEGGQWRIDNPPTQPSGSVRRMRLGSE